jgi:hypothetical protein
MSNDIANARLTLSYPAPGGGTSGPQAISVLAPFQPSGAGRLDIPAGTLTGVVFAVPFGTITNAVLAMIRNESDRPVQLRINGSANLVELPATDGLFVYGGSTVPGSTPLTALAVVTDGTHTNAGRVSYWVFGDPT